MNGMGIHYYIVFVSMHLEIRVLRKLFPYNYCWNNINSWYKDCIWMSQPTLNGKHFFPALVSKVPFLFLEKITNDISKNYYLRLTFVYLQFSTEFVKIWQQIIMINFFLLVSHLKFSKYGHLIITLFLLL